MNSVEPDDERIGDALRASRCRLPRRPGPGAFGGHSSPSPAARSRGRAGRALVMPLVVAAVGPGRPRRSRVARETPPEDLAVLFAPPPVDGLTVLAGLNDVSVAALGRMEGVK